MTKALGFTTLLIILTIGSVSVFADEVPASASAAVPAPAGQSETTSVGQTSAILDNIYLNYFGIYHGPSITNLDSPYTVNNKGKTSTTTGMYFDSEITSAYMIDSSIGIGPEAQFQLSPVFGQGITMGDYGIKIFDRHFISIDGFNMYANFYLQAPGGYDETRGMHYALKTTPALRYDVPHSRFSVGAWTEVKDYMGVASGDTFKLYAEPYVAYQLTGKLLLNVGYEMESHHNVGDANYLNFTTYDTDLQPGFIWIITPKILINPYLQIFTNTTVSTGTMALGAVVSASL